MNRKTLLKCYEKVNSCETFEELKEAIKFVAEGEIIFGRTRGFKLDQQVAAVDLVKEGYPPNLLTRSFGIRQQMLYLMYYAK